MFPTTIAQDPAAVCGSAAEPAWRLTPGCLVLPGGRALGSVQIGRFALGMGLPPPDLEIVDGYEGLSVCQQRSRLFLSLGRRSRLY